MNSKVIEGHIDFNAKIFLAHSFINRFYKKKSLNEV